MSLDIETVVLIIFVVLKLVGVISWSWFWVLFPLWVIVLCVIIEGVFSNSSWNE